MEQILELYKLGKTCSKIARKLKIDIAEVKIVLNNNNIVPKERGYQKGHTAWNSGLTNETDTRVKAGAEKVSNSLRLRYKNDNQFREDLLAKRAIYNSTDKFKEAHKKKAATRRKMILSGKLDVTHGVGAGNKCWCVTPNNGKIHLRSSYEFIFCLFLEYKKIAYSYEKLRFINKETGRVTIPDFLYTWNQKSSRAKRL